MNRLNVQLRWDEQTTVRVGQLAEDKHQLYFQYDPELLLKKIWLSPYKLPLQQELFRHKDMSFGPIFGLFDDSLPDAWGLLLMDRFLRKRGYSIENLSMLDRLAFLGENTMGALTYEPALTLKAEDTSAFDLHKLSRQSLDILSGKTVDVMPQLIKAGGSPGGTRPKVLVGVFKDQMVSGEADLEKPFEHWIVKFVAGSDLPDSGPVEYAYSLMAREAGIRMTSTRLFNTAEGDRFFGIKRFDREMNRRFHVHTFGNLIHSNHMIPSQDYDHLFKIVINLTHNHQDLERAFRQMVFNVLSNNRDDHVKNFAFIMNYKGGWSLSPAYDLTFAPGPGGEHSMTVLGEGKAPAESDVDKLGEKHGIRRKTVTRIVDEVSDAVGRFREFADMANVSKASCKLIERKIEYNFKLFRRT